MVKANRKLAVSPLFRAYLSYIFFIFNNLSADFSYFIRLNINFVA